MTILTMPFVIILIIFIIGIILIAKGTGPLFFYKQEKDVDHKNKTDLDNICKLYGIEYEIEFEESKNPYEKNLYIKSLKIKNNINFDN